MALMTCASGECSLEPRQGGFAVYRRRQPVRVTTRSPEGGLTVQDTDYETTFGVRCCLFSAYWDEDRKDWFVDAFAGAQRWAGHKSTREVTAALRRLGFTPEHIRQAVADARPPRRRKR